MNGYYPREVVENATSVAASQTDARVTKDFRISPEGSIHSRIDIVVDTVTVGAGITAKLQSTSGYDEAGAEKWVDAKTVAITADGQVSLSHLVEVTADQTHLPLRPKGRIVVTTGAGSAVRVLSVRVCQEE